MYIPRVLALGEIKQVLSYLMLGQQGGANRIKILKLLNERSYNMNQLANTLDLNYRTVKHHIDVLLDNDLIVKSGEGYGDVYFLSPRLEENYEMLQEMEKKLETVFESPTIYKKVIEQTHEGMIILDGNKDMIFLNNSAKEITGFGERDLLGKNIDELLEPRIHQNLEKEVLEEDEFVEKMIEIKTKNGEIKTVVITMDYFYFDGEEHKGYSLLMRDITKEKTQRKILDALMSHSEVMMAYLDLDFNLVYANSAYAERTDHPPEELVGKNHFELFPNGENKRLFKKVIEEGDPVSVKDRDLMQPENSDQQGLYWSLEPSKDDEGEVEGLILSSYEISDAG